MSWTTEIINLHGNPSVELLNVHLGDRSRSVWAWFLDGVNHNVAIEERRGGQWKATASGAEGTATWWGKSEPSDQTIRYLCATVGLLPTGVPTDLVAEVDRLRAENAAMLAVVRAAEEWRAQFSRPDDIKFPRRSALIAAVDALPNMQEPCDICSDYGCPDCRNEQAESAR